MVFGRTTYDSFAGAWPERELAGEEDAEFAKALGHMRKIVWCTSSTGQTRRRRGSYETAREHLPQES